MAILPESRYDDVRAALDPTLDDAALPSEVIGSDVYQGAAERWLLALDPLAATRTGLEKDAVERALVYQIAGLLSPAVPITRQINLAGQSQTFAPSETGPERTARLLGAAFGEVVGYLPSVADAAIVSPVIFTTVSGQRG